MFRTRWALATLVAGCLVGACSDDDPKPDISDPTPTVSSTAPTEVTTSPTVAPSQSPEETLKAWVDAENEALATGSTEALRAFESAKCQGCDDFPKPIEQVYAAGGSFQGGMWKLVNSHVEDISSTTAQLTAAVRVAGGTTVSQAGADPVHYKPQNHLMSFDLVMEGGNWRFRAISFVS
jgi:hypothetical protein